MDVHTCPRRVQQHGLPLGPHPDRWRPMPDGTRTCSYCGSLHPDDFVDICYEYLEDASYKFEPTDKGYKVYANRPGVHNAGDGGIKFYGWHVPEGDAGHTVNAAYQIALPVYRRRFKERWGTS